MGGVVTLRQTPSSTASLSTMTGIAIAISTSLNTVVALHTLIHKTGFFPQRLQLDLVILFLSDFLYRPTNLIKHKILGQFGENRGAGDGQQSVSSAIGGEPPKK